MNDDNPASKHKHQRNGTTTAAARAAVLDWHPQLNTGCEEALAGMFAHCRRTSSV